MSRGPRTRQEDCLLAGGDLFQTDDLKQTRSLNTDFLVVSVCDGLGGHDHGESASRYVCEQIQARIPGNPLEMGTIPELLAAIQADPARHLPENCGTTVAGVMIQNERVFAFNAGDSRVYKITPAGMTCISHDHSLVQGMVDSALIQKDAATTHPLRNFVDFGIGPLFQNAWKDFAVYLFEEDLEPGAGYLICSDGVHDLVTEDQMHEILMPRPSEKGPDLLAALEQKGLRDNTSFVVLETR